MSQQNYYEILGVSTLADQQQITHAFRRKALETHPDKNPHPESANRFNQAVRAYETLSDITRRAAYDLRVLDHRSQTAQYGVTLEQILRAGHDSIMDTPADDVLEEYIVGNHPPLDTCLMTFFRDLEQTRIFTLYRDGKAAYQQRCFDEAAAILDQAVGLNPNNILYRHYYGLALGELRRTRRAIAQLKTAIRIGEGRYPQRQCPGVRRALHDLYRRRGRLLRAWWIRRTRPELFVDRLSVADQEQMRVERVVYGERRKELGARRALRAPGREQPD